MTKKDNKFLTYKGKPLVRCKNTIYYGNIYDKYVIKIDIKSKNKVKDMEIADKLKIQLISNPGGEGKKVVKTSEKENLYLALDIAEVWLTRALEENK